MGSDQKRAAQSREITVRISDFHRRSYRCLDCADWIVSTRTSRGHRKGFGMLPAAGTDVEGARCGSWPGCLAAVGRMPARYR